MSTIRPLAAVLVLVLASATLPATAAGHAELVESAPADGATLDDPPRQVVLTFDDELDPAASELTVTDGAGEVVGEGGVDLQVADRNVLQAAIATEAGGSYTVSWLAASLDGHPIEGMLEFAVDDPTGSGGEAPDTAVRDLGPPTPLVVLGAALIAVGLLTARLPRLGNRA